MTTANLTAAQIDRIATMDAADAACWAAWYAEQNRAAEGGQARAERVIREMVGAGEVEPTEARGAAGVAATEFNAAVRMLTAMGCLMVTEAGMLAAG